MLPMCDLERMKLLHMLANECNFKHNAAVSPQGFGEIVVCRRSLSENKMALDFLPCEFCKFVLLSSIWRHLKLCKVRGNYCDNHPVFAEETNKPTKKTHISRVKNGRALLTKSVLEEDEELMANSLSRMRDDCIKDFVVGD
jgi:hypothetical protein